MIEGNGSPLHPAHASGFRAGQHQYGVALRRERGAVLQ
jgi:hypothetical protein